MQLRPLSYRNRKQVAKCATEFACCFRTFKSDLILYCITAKLCHEIIEISQVNTNGQNLNCLAKRVLRTEKALRMRECDDLVVHWYTMCTYVCILEMCLWWDKLFTGLVSYKYVNSIKQIAECHVWKFEKVVEGGNIERVLRSKKYFVFLKSKHILRDKMD